MQSIKSNSGLMVSKGLKFLYLPFLQIFFSEVAGAGLPQVVLSWVGSLPTLVGIFLLVSTSYVRLSGPLDLQGHQTIWRLSDTLTSS